MDSLIKIIAKFFIVIPALVAIYYLVRLKTMEQRKQAVIWLVSLGVLSLALAIVAQHIYINPRPPFKDGSVPLFKPSDYNGFPSDHTLFAAAIGFWLLRYNRQLAWAMLALAVVIGWSRVAAHVHHAVDVAGAIIIVGIAYLVVDRLLPKLLKQRPD